MEHDRSGFFRANIEVEKGEIFYHYFLNNDFSQPYTNNSEELISQNDPMKRGSVRIATEPFCAVQFDVQENFIFTLEQGLWVIRAISYHSWVQSLSIVTLKPPRVNDITNLTVRPFREVYSFNGRKYWLLLLEEKTRQQDFPGTFALQLNGQDRQFFLHSDQSIKEEPEPDKFFSFPGQVPHPTPEEKNLPPWSVGYQVMPDRFLKSDCQTDRDYFSQWGEVPGYYSYFGGDLQGIIQKLAYLEDLGIDFLYLNPIFYARTYHRYDIIDYYRIDPLLGSENELEILVKQAHNRGIKIILDLPLNHCSIDFFAFRDILANQENSVYRDWFHIHRFPVEVKEHHYYSSWQGNQDMPEFNLHHPAVRDYLAQAAIYWLGRFDIDGWRLDACTSMPGDFARSFVAHMKKVKKDIILIGESWHHESGWLFSEVGVHGLTDYSFYWRIIVPLLEKTNLALDKIAEAIMDLNYRYSYRYGRYCWNFLSNHDLPRLYSIIAEKSNYINALILLYALPGMPMVYYGEETALEGLGDPDNRRCMNWPTPGQNTRFGAWYKALNHLRKDHKSLFSQGNIAVPYLDNTKKLLMLERFTTRESMYFIFNFSAESHHVHLPPGKDNLFLDILTNSMHRPAEPAFDLESHDFKILYKKEE
ncbi:MAG: glycoside hydrolase family 13 protein [Acidobacteria bacterium]|nr:glycoside hydrolase family 13 protein [Acidobacteriota bacterium]